MRFVQLQGGDVVHRVNPEAVVRVSPHSDDPSRAYVHFAGDAWVLVRHDADDVMRRLDAEETLL